MTYVHGALPRYEEDGRCVEVLLMENVMYVKRTSPHCDVCDAIGSEELAAGEGGRERMQTNTQTHRQKHEQM